MQTKNIVTPSFPAALFEAQELWEQGYKISINTIPTTWGVLYEVCMEKDDEEEQSDEKLDVKLTRAEILAKARAARGSNKNIQA